jgi:hypothetical protein
MVIKGVFYSLKLNKTIFYFANLSCAQTLIGVLVSIREQQKKIET